MSRRNIEKSERVRSRTNDAISRCMTLRHNLRGEFSMVRWRVPALGDLGRSRWWGMILNDLAGPGPGLSKNFESGLNQKHLAASYRFKFYNLKIYLEPFNTQIQTWLLMFSYHLVYPSFPRSVFATPGDNEGPNEATSKINGKRPTRRAPTGNEKRSLVDRVFAPCVFRYQQKHLREFLIKTKISESFNKLLYKTFSFLFEISKFPPSQNIPFLP